MKKLTVLLIVSCLVSSALATWVDDFESYATGWTAIPSPWETGDGVVALYIQPNYGYLGSKGVGGAGGYNNSNQWRAVGAGDTVDQFYAKLILTTVTTYGSAALHLSGEKSITTDRVAFDMWDNGFGVSTLRLGSMDYDNNVLITGQYITVNGLAADTWYDVRITVSDNNYIGEYKEATSDTWINVGTVTGYDNFAHNYVGIRADRSGRVDDVGYVPEPATMALLGLGGLSLLRRKKTA